MGKPKEAKAALVNPNYNWGKFGGADMSGVNFSDTVNDTIVDAQGGTNRYLNELLNPSYNNESFRAREDLLNQRNLNFAEQMGARAIERGARGSATQNMLNSIMANRNNDMRSAMTNEDARIRNILANLQGIESNYFNQGNTMAGNVLNRILANASAQNQVNMANTQARNEWANNLIGGAASIGGAALGSLLAPAPLNIVAGA